MNIPGTRHARSGDVSIAHQGLGGGPFDLVRVPGFVSHVELSWQVPGRRSSHGGSRGSRA